MKLTKKEKKILSTAIVFTMNPDYSHNVDEKLLEKTLLKVLKKVNHKKIKVGKKQSTFLTPIGEVTKLCNPTLYKKVLKIVKFDGEPYEF